MLINIAIYLNCIYASCTAITRLITLANFVLLVTATFIKTCYADCSIRVY